MSGHVIERLSAYMDGELGTADRQVVDAHLRRCEECARHLEDLAAVDDLARALPLEAPEGYFDSLPSRVRFKVAPRPRRALRLPTWSWAVAAALLLAVVAPRVLERLSGPGAVATTEERVPAPSRSEPPSAFPAAPAAAAPAREASPSREAAATAPPPAPAAPKARPTPLQTTGPQPMSPPLALARSKAQPPPQGGAAATAAAGEAKAARSAAFAPEPDSVSLEGAAGQHLPESQEEKDVSGVEAAPDDARKREGPRASGSVGLRDADELRRQLRPEALRYRALLSEKPKTAEGARRLREQWRAFLELLPPPGQADEARVRIVETGIEAWRFSNDPVDLSQARQDAEAYLRRDDAAQGERVRSLLATVGN